MPAPAEPSSRRRFLAGLVYGLNAVTALLVAVPALGYLLGPLRRGGFRAWVSLGPASRFARDAPQRVDFAATDDASFAAGAVRRTAYVRRTADGWVVLSTRCTHMACNVAYDAAAGTFDCPCHGGRYDRDGAVLAGPPPRPLHRYHVRLTAGNLEIQA